MVTLDKEIYTAEELAEWFNVSQRTIARLVERREISALAVGSQYRFFRKDVEEFLERSMSYPTQA